MKVTPDLPLVVLSRGNNSKAGDASMPSTLVPNTTQQTYFAHVASNLTIDIQKPFVLGSGRVDTDGTQQNTGDSHNTVTPRSNSPMSIVGINNADVGTTAEKLLGFAPKSNLIGREIREAMLNGATRQTVSGRVRSQASANGLRTALNFKRVRRKVISMQRDLQATTSDLTRKTANKK